MLTINDIKEWLITNRDEYQNLKSNVYPPFGNGLYDNYELLKDFIEYYKYREQCKIGLRQLINIENFNFELLSEWVKQYEVLGSQDLLMFEINYIKTDEVVSHDKIKIHKGLYTEREPFLNIICFCKVFQHLYWDNRIHKGSFTDYERIEIINELKTILKHHYKDY